MRSFLLHFLSGHDLLFIHRPIAFHPTSIIFETPSHAELLAKVGVRSLITGVIDELISIAEAQGCNFPQGFREQTMEAMVVPSEANSTMYQDYSARRPIEIETYLGSPIKLAQEVGLPVPRIETLYALLHNLNVINQTRQQAPPSPVASVAPHPPRMASAAAPNGMYGPGPNRGHPMQNGMRPNGASRAPSATGGPPPMRRAPPSMNGYPMPRMPSHNGYGPRGPPPPQQRRQSMEGNDLEEFSHLMLYDNVPEGQLPENGAYSNGTSTPLNGDIALREREMRLRQKELALREREYHMQRGPPSQRRMPPPSQSRGAVYDDDDEDGDDYFDPTTQHANMPAVDPDQLDMMSVTSRRTRKAPSASQLRNNPDMGNMNARSRNPFSRPQVKNRTSARLTQDMPNLRDELMNNPLMGYSSDRYGNVDRHNLGAGSRTNSLTAERLSEFQNGGGPGGYPQGPPMPRRASQSPGHPLSPGGRQPMRPSPPNGYPMANGVPQNGRPSPPGVRQPVPRHPPGHGNAVAPQQVEQQVGVSNLYPPKSGPQVRSLTGSASASAGSGDSNRSAPIDSEPSAHSSSSSLGPRAPTVGVN